MRIPSQPMALLAMQIDVAPTWYNPFDAPEVLFYLTEEYLWLKIAWMLGAAVIVVVTVYSVIDAWKSGDN